MPLARPCPAELELLWWHKISPGDSDALHQGRVWAPVTKPNPRPATHPSVAMRTGQRITKRRLISLSRSQGGSVRTALQGSSPPRDPGCPQPSRPPAPSQHRCPSRLAGGESADDVCSIHSVLPSASGTHHFHLQPTVRIEVCDPHITASGGVSITEEHALQVSTSHIP